MCSKVYKVIFHKTGCEIREGSYGRLVVEGTRTNGNVYYVKDNKKGNCLLELVYNQTKDVAMILATPTTIIKINISEDKSWKKMVEEELNQTEESKT